MTTSQLPYRYLGSSGLKVSSLCLGTMTFGRDEGSRPGQSDEAMAHAILDRFVEVGGNFIDTADVYQQGEAERMLGQPHPHSVQYHDCGQHYRYLVGETS